MGFFDSLKAILDPKKWYTEDNLCAYFKYEIYGSTNPECFKTEISTNIHETLIKFIGQYYPKWNSHKMDVTSSRIQKLDEEFYKMDYKGTIRVYDDYNNYEGTLYFNVIVHANKYAELSTRSNQKTTTSVSTNPI